MTGKKKVALVSAMLSGLFMAVVVAVCVSAHRPITLGFIGTALLLEFSVLWVVFILKPEWFE